VGCNLQPAATCGTVMLYSVVLQPLQTLSESILLFLKNSWGLKERKLTPTLT
jgi:hypothetical protein